MLGLRTILATAVAVLAIVAPAAAQDYAAERTSFCCYETLEPGDQVEQFLEVRNVGLKTWYREGAIPVRLGTSNPMTRSSTFFTPGDWISDQRLTGLDALTVDPGQVGRFTWIATAPPTPGEYVEYYTPLAELVAWMNAGDIYYWRYTVIPAQAPILRFTASPARVKRGDGVPVSVDATDNRGVSKVTFAVGSQVVTLSNPTQGTSGFSATLDSTELAPGTHSVVVTAYDLGGRTSSAPTSFEVFEPTPPPPPASTRIAPFTPLFATRSARGSRVGTLFGVGSVTGLRPAARLRTICTQGCVRRLDETRTASRSGKVRLTLRHPQRLLRTTRIELRVSLTGYVTRYQRYRFRKTSSGTFARLVKSGCLASQRPRRTVRCPAV